MDGRMLPRSRLALRLSSSGRVAKMESLVVGGIQPTRTSVRASDQGVD